MPFLVGLLLILPLAVTRAWATVHLWHWFVMGQFGVAELSYRNAIGISMLVSFLTHQHKYDPADKGMSWEKLAAFAGEAIVLPISLVGFGWLFANYFPGSF